MTRPTPAGRGAQDDRLRRLLTRSLLLQLAQRSGFADGPETVIVARNDDGGLHIETDGDTARAVSFGGAGLHLVNDIGSDELARMILADMDKRTADGAP